VIEIVHIDGVPATVAGLMPMAMSGYGAFTSFQHEPGGVRGLSRHIDRLERSALALFGQGVPEDRLRGLLRAALADVEGRASVRVQLFLPNMSVRRPEALGRPSVMIRVSGPLGPLPGPLRLQSQIYQREMPHFKHCGIFGIVNAMRTARAAKFDDAVFVTADGVISEGPIWNIGFLEGQTVVWPRAEKLDGTAQALIERGLLAVGLNSVSRLVKLSDVADFDGAFICNSATPAAPISAIDETRLNTDPRMIERLEAAWATNPVEPI